MASNSGTNAQAHGVFQHMYDADREHGKDEDKVMCVYSDRETALRVCFRKNVESIANSLMTHGNRQMQLDGHKVTNAVKSWLYSTESWAEKYRRLDILASRYMKLSSGQLWYKCGFNTSWYYTDVCPPTLKDDKESKKITDHDWIDKVFDFYPKSDNDSDTPSSENDESDKLGGKADSSAQPASKKARLATKQSESAWKPQGLTKNCCVKSLYLAFTCTETPIFNSHVCNFLCYAIPTYEGELVRGYAQTYQLETRNSFISALNLVRANAFILDALPIFQNHISLFPGCTSAVKFGSVKKLCGDAAKGQLD